MANCGTYIFKNAAEFRHASEGLLECPEEADRPRGGGKVAGGEAVMHHAKTCENNLGTVNYLQSIDSID